MQHRLGRRAALATMGGAVLASPAVRAQSQPTLVVTMFGGVVERAFRTALIEPFEKATGARVVPKLGTPAEWLTNAMVNRRRPEIDILWLGFPESVRAVTEDVVLELNEAAIPSLRSIQPRLRELYDGKGVGHEWAALGLGYRTDAVTAPPKSWAELWEPRFAGQIAVPDIASPGGWELLMMAARLNGGDETNLEPGLEAIRRLKPGVKRFYRNLTEAANLVDSGEAAIAGPLTDFRAYALADQGKPVGFVLPSEGAVPSLVSFHIARATQNRELAERFLEFALSRTGLADFCNTLVCGPARPDVALQPQVARRVATFEQLVIFDWRKVVPNMRRYTDLWNREMAR